MNIILGGGIAGLIWSYYSGGKVISDNFGGQMSNHFQLGPRYLHKNQYSKKFLQDLNLPLKTKTVNIGYHYDNAFHKTICEEKIKEYFKKSRGGFGKLEDDKTVINGQKNQFEVFEVNFQTIIEKLIDKISERGDTICGRIKRIDCEKKIIHYAFKNDNHKIEYDKCISTIPLNLFLRFAKIKDKKLKLISMPTTYMLTKSFDLKEYDFVYFVSEDLPYHRGTKTKDGVVFDWIQEHSEKECKEIFGDSFIAYKVLNNAQIINKNKEVIVQDVKFVGRYGTWDRSWKTEKVIEEAMKYAKKN